MTDKMVEKFLYEGLAFPIELHNVKMREINGEFQPIIDVKQVANSAIQSLSLQQKKITGDQLAFVRVYVKKSVADFAKLIGASTQEVEQWEKLADKPINMPAKIENSLKQLMRAQAKDQLLSSKGMFSHTKPTPHSDENPDQPETKIKKKKN
jgi:DNA-binding transcriptional regulator YiaG